MVRAVNPTARRYRSTVRAEQAQDTRRRILEAAARLFTANGYAGTTVTAVADEAGVVPETIYATLKGKQGLLKGVLEASRGGIGDAAPFEQSERWDAITELPDPHQRLRAWVEYSGEILARTSAIHAVIRGAADGETFAAELREDLLRARLSFMTELTRRLLGDALRPGLTVEDAGQRFCTLVSPELHALLINELGWTPERHQQWIGDLLDNDLLGPTPGPVIGVT